MFSDFQGSSADSKSGVPAETSASNYQPTAPAVDVYVMPGKFLPEKPVKKADSSGPKKIIIIASVVLALVVALVAGAILYLNASINQVKNTNGLTVVDEVKQNTNPTPPSNASSNGLQNQSPGDQNTNSISNEVSPTSTPDNSGDNPPAVTANLDADNDGLTVEEEALFLTNVARDDSDRDGYKDGQELINLFNPLVPGQSLENSGLVNRYKNENFDYSVLIPKAWLPSPANTDNSELMFLTDSETGEFISITVTVNSAQQTLEMLKSSYFSTGDQTENFNLGGRPAWRTKIKVLMVMEQYVYVVEYHQNQSGQANFPAVLEMMLKSFELNKANDIEVQP